VHQPAGLEHQQPLAQRGYGLEMVTDKKNGSTTSRYIPHLAKASLLKLDVADGEHLVDQQNF
jgi:hypothetical protein